MTTNRNIVFDLGGVLLNIDYHKTTAAFAQLGVQDFDSLFSQQNANELFEKLETGSIREDDFYAAVARYCAPGTNITQMEQAWNAMLLNFRTDAIEHLQLLRQQEYNIYLLSNTNSIHLRAFEKILLAETGFPSITPFFNKAYYSHQIGLRKPHAEVYRFVAEDIGVKPEELFFIDDSIQNVQAAIANNWKAYHLLPGQKIQDIV